MKKRKRLTTAKAWGWKVSEDILSSRAEALKSLWGTDVDESELIRVRIIPESDWRQVIKAARAGGFEG